MAMTALKGISMIMTATPASTDGPRFCKIQLLKNVKRRDTEIMQIINVQ